MHHCKAVGEEGRGGCVGLNGEVELDEANFDGDAEHGGKANILARLH